MGSIDLSGSLVEFDQIKTIQVGGSETHGETQTTKLNGKELVGISIGILVFNSYLSYTKIRLTNLIRTVRYSKDLLSNYTKGRCLMTRCGIINVSIKFISSWNTTQSGSKVRKDLNITSRIRELRDHLRVITNWIPNNRHNNFITGLCKSGDGVAMVQYNIGRATVYNLCLRTLTSKAGLINQTRRGSDVKILNNTVEHSVHISAPTLLNSRSLALLGILTKSVASFVSG